MPRYLLTVSEESAAALEYWLGGQLRIGPAVGTSGVPVAGLDAITDQEYEPIGARLRTGGPLYHTAARRAPHPLDADPPRPLTGPEAQRWRAAVADSARPRVIEAIDIRVLTGPERDALLGQLIDAIEVAATLHMLVTQDTEFTRGVALIELGRAREHVAAARSVLLRAASTQDVAACDELLARRAARDGEPPGG